MDKHYLLPLFQPESIVVFTSPTGMDANDPALSDLEKNLLSCIKESEFKGQLHFVDIHRTGTLADLVKTRADLGIIALPTDQVMPVIELAARMECRSVMVLGQGVDATTANTMHRLAKRHNMHLLGPNGQGFQWPLKHLNASTLGSLAQPGPLALVSQSGALTAAILDWAHNNGVGFSHVISLGPNTSVDLAQALDFLATDTHTHSIVVYMEGITNARRFMSALRAAANAKPVVVLKAGRRKAGVVAAQTHSSSLVGSDDVFNAALRRAGAVRVYSFVQLFSATKCLASRYRPVGKRLAIVTNGGGPGVLAADWVSEIGLQLGQLSPINAQALKNQLPPEASLVDLLDLSEHAQAEHYRLAIQAADKEEQIDGILVIHSPKRNVSSDAVAQAMAQIKPTLSKPLLGCWMGDASVREGRYELAHASVPSFRTPESAVGAFNNIASFYQNQKLLQQTPAPLSDLAKPDIEGARLIIETVLTERRKVLTEMESKSLLSAFHIPVTRTMLARNANEAMLIASQLGYPVALKIDSPDISHKSDVNGVALNVMNSVSVRDIFNDMMQSVSRQLPQARINGITVQNMARSKRGRELYIGVVTDEPFGPVIAFGAGGTMIELINDRSMELPPLNQFLARSMIERSRVRETLGEWRGASAINMEALERVLLRVSEMVCELPQLREMDINPIIVDEDGVVAVDARIVVDNAAQPVDGRVRRYNHLAILPYPARFEQIWPLRGGGEYTIRPIRPDDAQMLQALVHGLSPQSRYFRFASSMTELPPSMLSRFTLIDYDREMALVAVIKEKEPTQDGEFKLTERIVGVSRYITNPDKSSCEFSLVVADDYNGRGLGSRLMMSIIDTARDKGLSEIEGLVLCNNAGMLRLMRSLGFSVKGFPADPDFKLVSYSL